MKQIQEIMTTLLPGPMHFHSHFLLILHYEFQPRDESPAFPSQVSHYKVTHKHAHSEVPFCSFHWPVESCSWKAMEATCCQWRSMFLAADISRWSFSFRVPPLELVLLGGVMPPLFECTEQERRQPSARRSVQRHAFIPLGTESSSKWPCRDSVLQVAKPMFPPQFLLFLVALVSTLAANRIIWPSERRLGRVLNHLSNEHELLPNWYLVISEVKSDGRKEGCCCLVPLQNWEKTAKCLFLLFTVPCFLCYYCVFWKAGQKTANKLWKCDHEALFCFFFFFLILITHR